MSRPTAAGGEFAVIVPRSEDASDDRGALTPTDEGADMPGEKSVTEPRKNAQASGKSARAGRSPDRKKAARAARQVADKRIEEGATDGEVRVGALVATSPVGFLIVQAGKIVFMNPEQERIFGKIPIPFDLEKVDPLVHRGDREAFLRLFREDCVLNEPRSGTSLRLFPRGRPAGSAEFAWFQCRAVPIRYRDRDAVLVNMVDVAQARDVELSGAVGGPAALERLAARIAHEIRNPLSGINFDISALEKLIEEAEALDAEKRRMARRIVGSLRKNSDRIEAVVRGVMGIARTHAPQFVPSDLNRCIRAAVARSSTDLRRSGVHIRAHLAEGLPAVQFDPRLLEEVILNLVANAAQALSPVEGPREIELSSVEGDGRLVIRVGDSGPGVPEADREKVFGSFFTTKRGASGIGLSFSKRVIDDHGGTLTVGTSHLGGAEFRIELPVAQPGADRQDGSGS